MKVNLRNSRIILALCVFYTALLLTQDVLELEEVQMSYYVYYAKAPLFEALYVAILLYFAQVLKWTGEHKSIATAFIIYVGFDSAILGLNLFNRSHFFNAPPIFNAYITLTIIGAVAFIIKLRLIISIFRIKAKHWAFYYHLFGWAMIIDITIKLALPILSGSAFKQIPHMRRYFEITELLCTIAMITIVNAIIRYLEEKDIARDSLVENLLE